MMSAVPIPLDGTPQSEFWRVPSNQYATGTLSVFINGVSQQLGVSYQTQHPSSGTYQVLETPPTGSYHFAIWGMPILGGSVSTTTLVTGSYDILAVQVFS